MSYSRFISGLHQAGVEVDRKVLADVAVRDPAAFTVLVGLAAEALGVELIGISGAAGGADDGSPDDVAAADDAAMADDVAPADDPAAAEDAAVAGAGDAPPPDDVAEDGAEAAGDGGGDAVEEAEDADDEDDGQASEAAS
jgi:hypothetical protein